jgi:hypothetical protein
MITAHQRATASVDNPRATLARQWTIQ